jgi:hypothetical protein
MRFKKEYVNKNTLSGFLLLAICLLTLMLPSMAGAVDYFVWGRVYCASPPAEGEEPSINPLTGVPPEQIIGEDMVAVIPRNLVKVRVIKASDGSELGDYIARQDGGYLISFNTAGGGISVRFIVEELGTSKVLLESGSVNLSPWPTPNIRFLLVLEGLAEIGSDREFAPAPPHPANYTAIFTRIGKIEVATEVGGTTQHLIDPATGFVNVPASVASDLHIPQYQDSPLGGNLYIFGAFSQDLYYMPNIYYRIRIDNLDTSTSEYMDDPLVKTKYIVNLTTGTVSTVRVTLGPEPKDGYANCYELTPIATINNEFWSFPDLVALWRTGGLNGNYRITLEVIDLSGPEVPPTAPPPPADYTAIANFTDLRLHLDNIRPDAQILPLEAGDPDTPRVYIPSPPDTGIGCDLMNNRLGSYPVDYGGTADPTCSILDLQAPVGRRYLAFKLKAYHSNGYLRYWHFKYKRNDTGYQIHLGKTYNGSTMADYSTVQCTSTVNDVHGFQDKFLYLNTNYLQPGGGTDMHGCAYRFVITAATRTTNGYNYLRWDWDEDLHYVLR